MVASPNVQENFKLQLFDHRKLKLIDGLWNLRACTGNKYLKEINPMNMRGLNRKKIVRQIKRLIKQSYIFKGYGEFANYIEKIMNKNIPAGSSEEVASRIKKKNLGKVVADVFGYKIRIMLESKTTETMGRDNKPIRTSVMGDSGKLGVYAGRKKLVKDGFTSLTEAKLYVVDLISK